MFAFAPYGSYWRDLRKIVTLELLSNRRIQLLSHVRVSEVGASIKELYKRWTGSSSHFQVELNQWFEKEGRRCLSAIKEFIHLLGKFVPSDAIPGIGWLDLGGYEKAMKKTAKDLDYILSECHNLGYDCRRHRYQHVYPYVVNISIELLNNFHVLTKAQEELDVHVGKDRFVKESDLGKLVYIPAIIKETLRLHSPAPLLLPHEFTEDCIIAGFHISKGTRLMTNLWKIHTDRSIWTDLLEFKPERFLTTHKYVELRGNHYEFIPFGSGRRICPGISFGLRLLHFTLATFQHPFEISSPIGAPVNMPETFGVTNLKSTLLQVLVKPRLPSNLYTK
ncbi:Cytochrome P450 family protein [Quillaja saponaria]|uniref:Cytochrome P450 family protein n=1 Tax=Quillaja saponaria TaxID=32244 RepID=A0AAD7PMX0_QUISA|nr:Cytochrome P450 family protein [Quillaja saponaria]